MFHNQNHLAVTILIDTRTNFMQSTFIHDFFFQKIHLNKEKLYFLKGIFAICHLSTHVIWDSIF